MSGKALFEAFPTHLAQYSGYRPLVNWYLTVDAILPKKMASKCCAYSLERTAGAPPQFCYQFVGHTALSVICPEALSMNGDCPGEASCFNGQICRGCDCSRLAQFRVSLPFLMQDVQLMRHQLQKDCSCSCIILSCSIVLDGLTVIWPGDWQRYTHWLVLCLTMDVLGHCGHTIVALRSGTSRFNAKPRSVGGAWLGNGSVGEPYLVVGLCMKGGCQRGDAYWDISCCNAYRYVLLFTFG